MKEQILLNSVQQRKSILSMETRDLLNPLIGCKEGRCKKTQRGNEEHQACVYSVTHKWMEYYHRNTYSYHTLLVAVIVFSYEVRGHSFFVGEMVHKCIILEKNLVFVNPCFEKPTSFPNIHTGAGKCGKSVVPAITKHVWVDEHDVDF